jgi:hypothetical protein
MKTHGGKREGAGRKTTPFPTFTKKLRATEFERQELLKLLTGDARKDFILILQALKELNHE